jgi:hypothetical protein
LDEQAPASSLLDERDGFRALGFATAGDDDLGALTGESDGRDATDAGGASGDEDNFIFKYFGPGFVGLEVGW